MYSTLSLEIYIKCTAMYRKLLPEQNTAMWAGNLPSSVVAKELESNIECVLEIVLRCVLGNRLGGVIRNLLRVHM